MKKLFLIASLFALCFSSTVFASPEVEDNTLEMLVDYEDVLSLNVSVINSDVILPAFEFKATEDLQAQPVLNFTTLKEVSSKTEIFNYFKSKEKIPIKLYLFRKSTLHNNVKIATAGGMSERTIV